MKLVASASALAVASLAAIGATASPAAAEVRDICFPVEGGADAVTFTDSFGDPRGGGTRTHEGQDLMSVDGVKMRRLLSAVDGTVVEVKYDNAGGNRVVIRDDEGWFYVYIHVNNDSPGTDDGMATFEQAFAPGLEEGQRVSRCEHVAYIGDSGNAEGAGAHLHFEIREPVDSDRPWAWSSATAVNVYDSLRAALGETTPTVAPSGRWRPFESVGALVEQQYVDFYGRTPDSGGEQYWADRLSSGAESPASFIGKLLVAPEFESRIAPIARLYWAYFDRIPDTEGLLHWIDESSNGTTLGEISQFFAGSDEFASAYGSLDDVDFVDLVYQNVLGRPADRAGREYWAGRLYEGDLDRGGVMTGFSDSPEYRVRMTSKVRVVLAYVAMLERSPDEGGLAHWSELGADALVTGVYASDEYAARIVSL